MSLASDTSTITKGNERVQDSQRLVVRNIVKVIYLICIYVAWYKWILVHFKKSYQNLLTTVKNQHMPNVSTAAFKKYSTKNA